ncbi:pyridoxamine 5'-phosphate oxidase family protein [Pseudonocardia oroxyli]|uniref:Pyridoxamine 5'-phosphate oxidase n=1 Tax=Pseudonocardia oroxyli TaxID=366584 RepID=A0A1G7KB39_PSEOR|nr:pyridoxamine 5'-phosphate oxidase family protein [Pseudonocardia oroxyli]SDF34443.1 Pyridoxamine 5'-phosphate oxidase [Pseudonocardia oroxyli]
MTTVHDGISDRLRGWLEEQPVFFVGTAPLSGDGLINLSPKGTRGTFRVVDAHTVAYLDLTGSGVETIAHLRENGRICVMFCAFDGRPTIVRLHGTGSVLARDEPGFAEALAAFGEPGTSRRHGARSVITVAVQRVADSCGYAVPRMDLVEERNVLDLAHAKKSPQVMVDYHREKNARSLDGLPGL